MDSSSSSSIRSSWSTTFDYKKFENVCFILLVTDYKTKKNTSLFCHELIILSWIS